MYTHSGIVFSHKRSEIWPFVATWMDLEGYYPKRNKSEENKYCMISLVSGI